MHTKPILLGAVALLAACATSSATTPASQPSSASGDGAAGASYGRLVRAAQAYVDAGKAERAAEIAEQAAAKEPERPDAYFVWGLALAQLGRLEDSAAKLETARSHGGGDRLLFAALASVYDVSRRYGDAVSVYREYLAKHPDDAAMRQELGLTLLLIDRFDEAVAELERAVSLLPAELQLQQDLGYALLRAGKPAEATRVLQVVTTREPARHDAQLFLARALAAQGRAAEAITLLDALVAANANDEQALRMRAKLRAITGAQAGAVADYEALLQAQPQDPALLLGLAGALIAQGELHAAEQTLDRVRPLLREHPLLSLREAQLAWRRNDRAALAVVARFARDNPGDVEAWRELLAAARKMEDRKLAKEAAARLEKLGD